MGKATDFRYNTGATKVPWAAVGENYNAADLMEIIKFLMQGEGEEYDQAINAVWEQVKKGYYQYGIRTFWDLQQDQARHKDPAWQEKMIEVEQRVAQIPQYRDIAFFHHLIMEKRVCER